MATFAIGDIHGHLTALDDLLAKLKQEATRGDVVVFLGDYLDRGPDPKGCVERILAFQRNTEAEVVSLCGNHEDAFLRTLRSGRHHSWLLGMEGFDTVRSYSPEAADILLDAAYASTASLYLGEGDLPYQVFFDAIPTTHRTFFDGLVSHYRDAVCVCTHGGLDPRVTRFEDQPTRALIWGSHRFPAEYGGEETVVYGHWNNPVLNGEGWPTPRFINNTIGVDSILHGVLNYLA